MTTQLQDAMKKLKPYRTEIDLLLDQAHQCEEKSRYKLANAICRSVCVLKISHFEGFLKWVSNAVILDLNKHVHFSELHEDIKRTNSKHFYKPSGDGGYQSNEVGIKRLLERFSKFNVDLVADPFVSNGSANPKPASIQNLFSNFGVRNFFLVIDEHNYLSEPFFMTHSEFGDELRKIARRVDSNVSKFPYGVSKFPPVEQTVKAKNQRKTLWEDSLNEMNRMRHEVAHGTNFENERAAEALRSDYNKLLYLQYGILEFLSSWISKKGIVNLEK